MAKTEKTTKATSKSSSSSKSGPSKTEKSEATKPSGKSGAYYLCTGNRHAGYTRIGRQFQQGIPVRLYASELTPEEIESLESCYAYNMTVVKVG